MMDLKYNALLTPLKLPYRYVKKLDIHQLLRMKIVLQKVFQLACNVLLRLNTNQLPVI